MAVFQAIVIEKHAMQQELCPVFSEYDLGRELDLRSHHSPRRLRSNQRPGMHSHSAPMLASVS